MISAQLPCVCKLYGHCTTKCANGHPEWYHKQKFAQHFTTKSDRNRLTAQHLISGHGGHVRDVHQQIKCCYKRYTNQQATQDVTAKKMDGRSYEKSFGGFGGITYTSGFFSSSVMAVMLDLQLKQDCKRVFVVE